MLLSIVSCVSRSINQIYLYTSLPSIQFGTQLPDLLVILLPYKWFLNKKTFYPDFYIPVSKIGSCWLVLFYTFGNRWLLKVVPHPLRCQWSTNVQFQARHQNLFFFFAILIIDYCVIRWNCFAESIPRISVIKVYFRMMPFCFDDSEAIDWRWGKASNVL